MAFQKAGSLQSIATVSHELSQFPFRRVFSRSSSVSQPRSSSAFLTPDATSSAAVTAAGRANLSSTMFQVSLRAVPLSTLGIRPSADAVHAARPAATIFASVTRHVPQNYSPLAQRLSQSSCYARQYSTLTRLGPFKLQSIQRPHDVIFGQYRTAFGANSSRISLSHMEQTANNNPASATAQNAFYSALLRANMPEIVVERYGTGRYASNPACEQLYLRALDRVGQAEKVAAESQGPVGNFSADQISSIGSAIGAKVRGGNTARLASGTGTKDGPLYVIVEETTFSSVFKWVKFLFWFGLFAWLSVIVIGLIVEATGTIKRVGASQNAEARPELQTTRFSDVHGCDEAKEELQELVEFLKAPERFSNLGGKLPKGVLLVGPPGTGKTLLARAVAGEAGVPFFYMSGSEFDEVYVGVGAKRVRELFSAARQKAPAIVFIDELDAIGGKRNERDAAYVKQTLNQLLTDLDGFDQNSGVIFLAATNFPQLLDKALTRPGRFDRNVVVPLPDVRGRVAILKHHMRNMQFATEVDATVIARGTSGMSGADLENLVNQAAIRASKFKAPKISMLDLEWAKDKILMGAERRSAVIQEKDKLATAYHEAGHALVALFNPDSMPLYKATIMPRGNALGITFRLPEMDVVSQSKKQYLADLDVSMGGKVAEEMIYGEDGVTSGASNDLQGATSTAHNMVARFGMSPKIGNMDVSDYNNLSPELRYLVESETRRLLEESHARAMKLLTEKRKELELLAHALVKYETLDKSEIEKVIRGESLPDKLIPIGGTPIKLPETKKPTGANPPSPPPTPPSGGIPIPMPGTGVPTAAPSSGIFPRGSKG